MSSEYVPAAGDLAAVVLNDALSIQDIVDKLGLTMSKTLYWCGSYGIHRPKKTVTRPVLRKLVHEGCSDAEIALRFGQSLRHVSNLRAQFRIYGTRRREPPRPVGGNSLNDGIPRQMIPDDAIDALYAGARYEDDPVAMRPTGVFRGRAPSTHSECGCAADMCAV